MDENPENPKPVKKRISRRRWSLLRQVVKEKEVHLDDYRDITKRVFTPIGLLEREEVEQPVGDGSNLYKLIKYKLGRTSITMRQNDDKKIRVDKLSLLGSKSKEADRTGMVTLWPSEEALAYLCMKRPHMFKGKSIIEIGAGLGLAGLVLAATSEAKCVIVTDGNSRAVEHLRDNVSRNMDKFGDTIVRGEKLHWSREGHEDWQSQTIAREYVESFDFVICSDCVYHENLYKPLADTLVFLSEISFSKQIRQSLDQAFYCDFLTKNKIFIMSPNRNKGHVNFLKVVKANYLQPEGQLWTVEEEFNKSYIKWIETAAPCDYPHLLVLTG